ncbi:MAG TPA: hypothetical protein DCR93_38410 [Cytophagales bacterium]|nr:hypothetical protein [Cytophagales bacterium]HAP65111.1 hypothetical protein [Cytophagales bacterium]
MINRWLHSLSSYCFLFGISLCVYTLPHAAYSQQRATIDSAQAVLDTLTGASRAKALIFLAEEIRPVVPDSSLYYAREAKTVAQAYGLDREYGMADVHIGFAYFTKGDNASATTSFQKAMKWGTQKEINEVLAYAHYGLGMTGGVTGNLMEAMEHYQNSQALFGSLEEGEMLLLITSNLGNLFYSQKDYATAYGYFLKAYQQQNELGVSSAHALLNLGTTAGALDSVAEGIVYLHQALEEFTEENNQHRIAWTKSVLGSMYRMTDSLAKAEVYYREAEALAHTFDGQQILGICWTGLSLVYYQKGQLAEAYTYGQKGFEMATATQRAGLIGEAMRSLIEIQKARGNYADALDLAERRAKLNDSIVSNENFRATVRRESEFAAQHRVDSVTYAQQVERLAYQNRVRKQQWGLWAIGGGLFCCGLVILLQIRFSRLRQRSADEIALKNQMLQESNEEIEQQRDHLDKANSIKDRIFSVIAHDLRSPLNTLQSMLELFVLAPELDKQQRNEMIGQVGNRVNSLLYTLDNLLKWSITQMEGSLELQPQGIDLETIANETMEFHQDMSMHKGVTLAVDLPASLPMLWVDIDALRLVLRNLVGNALKFTSQSGKVSILAETTGKHIKVLVTDTGVGMDADTRDGIFGPGVTSKLGTNNEKGTGLGLVLSQEFIERSGGSIGVESALGIGSTFWFLLPVAPVETNTQTELASSLP